MKSILFLFLCALVGAAPLRAALTPTTTRLALTGSVAPEGLSKLMLTRADSAVLEVGLFDPTGEELLDLTGLTDITLEIYASSEAAAQASAPITLLSGVLNPGLTLEQWTAGTAEHASFSLDTDQTNITMTTRQLTLWGVIYGTLSDGSRRTFGAGNITLRNGNAGGALPAAALDPLYPTLSQLLAYQAQVDALEARVLELESGATTTYTILRPDGTSRYKRPDGISNYLRP